MTLIVCHYLSIYVPFTFKWLGSGGSWLKFLGWYSLKKRSLCKKSGGMEGEVFMLNNSSVITRIYMHTSMCLDVCTNMYICGSLFVFIFLCVFSLFKVIYHLLSLLFWGDDIPPIPPHEPPLNNICVNNDCEINKYEFFYTSYNFI